MAENLDMTEKNPKNSPLTEVGDIEEYRLRLSACDPPWTTATIQARNQNSMTASRKKPHTATIA